MYAHVPPDSAELFKDIQCLCVVGYQYHLGRGQRGMGVMRREREGRRGRHPHKLTLSSVVALETARM